MAPPWPHRMSPARGRWSRAKPPPPPPPPPPPAPLTETATATLTPTPTLTWTPTATPTETPVAGPLAGDINLDSQVNVIDVQLGVNVFLGTEADPGMVSRADVNAD